MSELFEWRDDYSVGIKGIDDQHKKFFAMLNDLHSAMREGKGKDVLNGILIDVVDYAATHFAYEEAVLQQNNYPFYAEHKKIHDNFAEGASDMQRRARSGSFAVTIEVMARLREWLVSHITNEDQRYSPYLTQRKAA